MSNSNVGLTCQVNIHLYLTLWCQFLFCDAIVAYLKIDIVFVVLFGDAINAECKKLLCKIR